MEHILCANYLASLWKESGKQMRHHPDLLWVGGQKLRNHIYEYLLAI